MVNIGCIVFYAVHVYGGDGKRLVLSKKGGPLVDGTGGGVLVLPGDWVPPLSVPAAVIMGGGS